MKKLILITILSTLAFADSISLTGLAFSNHEKHGHNEQHNWIGLKYTHDFNKDFKFNAEIASFKNSYFKNTKMATLGVSWLPVQYKKIKAGVSINSGVQKGYCMDGFTPKKCEKGENDTTPIIIPSIQIEYNIKEYYNIGLNISSHDNDVFGRFYLTLFKF